ncbi:MAG TPA: 2-C-methyl-D-erythritol 2,4-cyclodiphosphate synthase [candidate division Zixibacteria bacterium]|nr:2-C-methyl-D-erythritol 2,4-cyclodiphosphate synthase [candidate division Zixibacteria bacterium]MDD4918940.1 2-C-methyl-D-erythritol 2,4-cyclodiphosphate synthase [candidate division Zixibacteria bacterium]MDM7973861.1 2-C-methyl-D-erythritol 2,4-cyclodiphosphate synthase [candidate division Zixibacteria bacterium]HOD67641.1 2-C-methyl-D-erythritol 2,4-cyclodiphosphate synthase [candidate division Zixibacteria bacterium]HOZ07790.1 2-C-methyl-D-erythritol 2,4-cyclodiphosphate synthase [candi
MADLRIGHGFDVHAFADDRELVVGGVIIPHERGLAGWSDADVLLHAIMDALLGAAGLPDIGQQFPPGDPAYRQADSAVLLSRVGHLVRSAGYTRILNIDAIIMAERPRMNPHIPAMRKAIAEVLRIKEAQVNVKATTTEQLGFVGREEGIAASAVCLIAGDE